MMGVRLSVILSVLLRGMKEKRNGEIKTNVMSVCWSVSRHHTLDPENEFVYSATWRRWLAVDLSRVFAFTASLY